MKDCVFCRIVEGSIPAERVAEGEGWLAFRDIDPKAPVHILVIPREHVRGVDALEEEHLGLAGELLRAAAEVAHREGATGGYRVVTNVGPDAGQSVFHLHLHVLGGRRFGWPPG